VDFVTELEVNVLEATFDDDDDADLDFVPQHQASSSETDHVFISGEIFGPSRNFLTNNRSGERNFAYVQQLCQCSPKNNSMTYDLKQSVNGLLHISCSVKRETKSTISALKKSEDIKNHSRKRVLKIRYDDYFYPTTSKFQKQ